MTPCVRASSLEWSFLDSSLLILCISTPCLLGAREARTPLNHPTLPSPLRTALHAVHVKQRFTPFHTPHLQIDANKVLPFGIKIPKLLFCPWLSNGEVAENEFTNVVLGHHLQTHRHQNVALWTQNPICFVCPGLFNHSAKSPNMN